MTFTKEESGLTLDLSRKGLKKLPPLIERPENYHTCIVNENLFSRLEGFSQFKELKKLYAKQNHLVKPVGLSDLVNLVDLDLSENTLQSADTLKSLRLLERLNLAGNNIKDFSALNYNFNLRRLDLSNNAITCLSNISNLKFLQTLNLSRNLLSSLSIASKYIPASLVSLDLSENEIQDLCEVSSLHFLVELEFLGIAMNPCFSNLRCEYRCYIINWCTKLKIIDLQPVSHAERLKAEWLFSQGLGHRFSVGEHVALVEYLSCVCPLNQTDSNSVPISIIREAWPADNNHTNLNSSTKEVSVEANSDSVQVEESELGRRSVETTSKLQSESVFLPVSQSHDSECQKNEDIRLIENVQKRLSVENPVDRPLTAPSEQLEYSPASQNKIPKPISEYISPQVSSNRPKTSPSSASSLNKYQEYESRPCRPMSKQLMRELYDEEEAQNQQKTVNVSHPIRNRAQQKPSHQPQKLPGRAASSGAKAPGDNGAKLRNRAQTKPNMASKVINGSEDKRGFSRNVTPKTPEKHKNTDWTETAAIKIQALWRGYWTRKLVQPQLQTLALNRYGKMVNALIEMRRRDTEHIHRLEDTLAERDRQDRKARRLQTAAIKQLWEQLQNVKQQLNLVLGKNGTELSGNPLPAVSVSRVHDENVSSISGEVEAPLSSLVSSDTYRTINGETSPRQHFSSASEISRYKRSPYAVRHNKEAVITPTKSELSSEDIKRAVAKSPLATPPRTRTTTEGRRMALAANFSHFQEPNEQ